jgi:hypothetical protein
MVGRAGATTANAAAVAEPSCEPVARVALIEDTAEPCLNGRAEVDQWLATEHADDDTGVRVGVGVVQRTLSSVNSGNARWIDSSAAPRLNA